jgi:hypothetical protein
MFGTMLRGAVGTAVRAFTSTASTADEPASMSMSMSIYASEDKMIDGLWVQNASGNELPKFYVTEIILQ